MLPPDTHPSPDQDQLLDTHEEDARLSAGAAPHAPQLDDHDEEDARLSAGAAPHAPQSDDHTPRSDQAHGERLEQHAPAMPTVISPPETVPGAELTMPGEDDGALDTPATPESAPAATGQRSSRNALLGTAAALALGMLAAGGGYYAWTVRAPSSATSDSMASNGTVIPAPVRPSQVLAANQADQASPGAAVPTRPTPAPPRTEPRSSARRVPVPSVEGDAAEILSLRTGGQQAAAPAPPPPAVPEATSAAALPPSPPAEAAAAPPAPVRPAVSAEAAPASTPAAAPSSVAPTLPSPASNPPDAADVAATFRPAPMTPQAQVDVLALVTQMGALVRDMRDENAALRSQVAMLTETVQGRTTDFEQRLNLAEARNSVAAAMGAGHRPVVTPILSTSGASGGVTRAIAAAPGTARTVRDYRVQAASPGTAVLADVNAPPGQAAGLQVKAGEMVPGVGRVISIAQRGTAWVVQTDHGVIQ